MNTPVALELAVMDGSVDASHTLSGAYDSEQQLWVGGDETEAAWGCTKFTVGLGPMSITYGRLLWDMGPAGCSY